MDATSKPLRKDGLAAWLVAALGGRRRDDRSDEKPRAEMRPIVRHYKPGERYEITPAGLAEWRASEAFKTLTAAYRSYPLQSLISDDSRALLHHLVVMRRPERVLEIGTFRCGTTQVFARALWEAGHGHLDTIDPFGADHVPPIIEAYPAELRERITFRPVNSASHFNKEMLQNGSYDLVFIDGDHEFEYALFDLLCSARLIRPRGLVVLDNIDQPGPRLATKVFLQHFPEWRDVADVVRKINPAAPFAVPLPSFPDTNFYLLEAPQDYFVRQDPRTFGSMDVDRAEVDGIELEPAAPARGTLHLHVFVRTFDLPEPEEQQHRQSLALDPAQSPADGRVRIPLDVPLCSKFPQPGLRRQVEIVLAFDGDSALVLHAPPRPYPAKHGPSL
jgi:predicted O-methyltransferase YrrM